MAATDDMMRFAVKNFEAKTRDYEVKDYGRAEFEFDRNDYADSFDFDFGGDDLGF
ncbi:MAG: hypothetical protein AAGK00_01495 [Pseudomonadota bacterium]